MQMGPLPVVPRMLEIARLNAILTMTALLSCVLAVLSPICIHSVAVRLDRRCGRLRAAMMNVWDRASLPVQPVPTVDVMAIAVRGKEPSAIIESAS